MTLTAVKQLVQQAQQEKYAILLFDIFDIPSAEGFFDALEAQKAPGIAGVYGGVMKQANAHALVDYLLRRAGELTAPVGLMLDHGESLEQCRQAMAWGFTDVMFDGSSLPFAENLAVTQAVVQAARAGNVGVEAELGHVGSGSEYGSYGAKRLGFTDPLDAEQFARQSGVDMLAVAIGTAHGVYQGDPHLDLDLLREIQARVTTPLVLHGGSGLSPEQFRAAIAGGIAKINVATEFYLTSGQRLAEAARAGEASYFKLAQVATDSMRERSMYYLDLFGGSGKVDPAG